jgi:hypothetical protein
MTKDSGDLAPQYSSCSKYSAQFQRLSLQLFYTFYKTNDY